MGSVTTNKHDSNNIEEVGQLIIHHLLHNEQLISDSIGLHDVNQIVALLLFGSRLYQCHDDKTSDYDFICLVNTETVFTTSFFIDFIHDNGIEYNVNVYHLHFFDTCLCREQELWALMCFHIPNEFNYIPSKKNCLDGPSLSNYSKSWSDLCSFQTINYIKLKKSVLFDVGRNMQKAKRFMNCGNIREGKKNLAHAFRKLNFAIQLLETGGIYDFSAGNAKYFEIMAHCEVDWKYYEQLYNDEIDTWMHNVKHFRSEKEMVDRILYDNISDHVRAYGLDSLTNLFSIHTMRPFKQYPNLVLLSLDEEDSPLELPIVQTCVGVVLDQDNDWELVARTHSYVFQYRDDNSPYTSLCPKITPSSKLQIQEKLDGIHVTLFWYNGTWLTFSTNILKPHFLRLETANLRTDLGDQDLQNGTYVKATWINYCLTNNEDINRVFWNEWHQNTYNLSHLCHNRSYSFELIQPSRTAKVNRCIAHKSGLHLFFVFDISSLRELDIFEVSSQYQLKHIPCMELSEILRTGSTDAIPNQLRQFICTNFQVMEQEGCIIIQDGKRLKVQSSQFLALRSLLDWSHLHPNARFLFMLDLVRFTWNDAGFVKFFEKYSPEFQSLYTCVHEQLQILMEDVQNTYKRIEEKSGDSMQQFSKLSKASRYPSMLFDMKKYKLRSLDYLQNVKLCPTKKLSSLVKLTKHGSV